jgi:hypothetical protein
VSRRIQEGYPAMGSTLTGRRFVVAAISIALSAGAGVFGWRPLGPLPQAVAAAASTGDPWGSFPAGWTELPPPPVVDLGATIVWTGSELLSWGGYDPTTNTATTAGSAFDPVARTWTSLPAAPVTETYASGVWTGHEAIFWGSGSPAEGRVDGVAYDPIAQTWRVIAPAPIPTVAGTVTVWTGSELVLFGGGRSGDPVNVEGAAYDPTRDAWQQIADAPIGLNHASGLWDGREVLVFGSLLNAGNNADTRHAVGEAFDPSTDIWHVLAPSRLSPQASSAVWIGGQGMFAWDYTTHGAWYHPNSDTWSKLQKLPLRSSECYPDSVNVGRVVFAFFCGNVVIDDPPGRWIRVSGGLTAPVVHANSGTYRLYRFATLAAAGPVVALAAEGITITHAGQPCYGCPGSPTSFWVYRPTG